MAKQQTEPIADDLMADSLQAENYLKQGRTCSLATIQLGLEDWLHHYLYRYQKPVQIYASKSFFIPVSMTERLFMI